MTQSKTAAVEAHIKKVGEPYGWSMATLEHRASFVKRLEHSMFHVMSQTDIEIRWQWYARGWFDNAFSGR